MPLTNNFTKSVRLGVLACGKSFSAIDVCNAMNLEAARAPQIRTALNQLTKQGELKRTLVRNGQRVAATYERTVRFKGEEVSGAGQAVAASMLDQVLASWTSRREGARA